MKALIDAHTIYADHEVAELLSFPDVQSVRDWIERLDLPAFDRGGKWWIHGLTLQFAMERLGRDQLVARRRPPQANSRLAHIMKLEAELAELREKVNALEGRRPESVSLDGSTSGAEVGAHPSPVAG